MLSGNKEGSATELAPDSLFPDRARPESSHDALVMRYLPYAASIANKIAQTLPRNADIEEILCNARLGLLEAAKRFDPTLLVDFKTFSYYRIKGAIFDGLRKNGLLPRSIYSRVKLERAANEYLADKRQRGGLTEVEKSEVNALYNTVSHLASVCVVSIDAMENFEIKDEQSQRDIERKAEFQKIKEKMKCAIEDLPDKERKLVKMYYFQNKTLGEIGDLLGLSKSWTCRLHARALEMLFERITSMNVKAEPEV